MMKRIINLSLCTLLILCLLAGCNRMNLPSSELSSSVSSKSSSESSKQPDITIAGVVFLDDSFMLAITKGYEDAAKDAGVTLISANTNNDQGRETELIDTYIAQKVDGIAITPLSDTDSIAALKKAHEAGIKLALTNIKLDDTSFIVGGYCADDEMRGKQVGEAAAAFIKKQGWESKIKLGIIGFEHSMAVSLSQLRINGFQDGLRAQGIDFEIVSRADDHTADGAQEKVERMLEEYPELQIVFCANEGSTIGTAHAVAASKNKGKTFVFGYDASEDVADLLLSDDDNVLQAAVTQDSYTMGYKAVEQLVKVIRGEAQPTGKFEVVPGIVLSRNDPEGIKKWQQEYLGLP